MPIKMRILVVVFDGLDFELIDKYKLKYIKQNEFRRINNYNGMSSILTSEIIASFITGKLWPQHGIKGLMKIEGPYLYRLFDKFRYFFLSKFPFFIKIFRKIFNLLDGTLKIIFSKHIKKRVYNKNDLKVETIFDKISQSKALFIPSYNPDFYWIKRTWVNAVKKNGIKGGVEVSKILHDRRKNIFFNELRYSYNLLMCHFQYPDWIHHLFYEIDDMKKVKQMYLQMDLLAKNIINNANNYHLIILMSDHGLPSFIDHNHQAFYSSNISLFTKTPHICDFYKKLIGFYIENLRNKK